MAECAFPFAGLEEARRGGSGTVYRASHRGGAAAALKVGRRDEEWTLREAALVATLHRRWGPDFLDAGRVPRGVAGLSEGAPYLALSWIDGTALDELSLDADERGTLAAIVAHGVGRALDELHALGVRHGDVKPANVIVTRHARPSRDSAAERGATLIDLSLSADVTQEARGGTERYVAPEVRAGEPATPAADLWALGIVLAEIRTPALKADPEPSGAALSEGRASSLDAWIEALLARAPGARPSAAWIAARAARHLGLAADPEEELARRRARVRRAYLGLRAIDVGAGASTEAISGPPREWLEEALTVARKLDADRPVGKPAAPLDRLGVSRWLVALVGASAAEWTAPFDDEGKLAAHLLDLCSRSAPEAWTEADLAGADHGAVPRLARAVRDRDRALALTRALLAPKPDSAAIAAAEDEVARGSAPSSLSLDLASLLLRRGEIGRASAALALSTDRTADVALLRAEVARRRGDFEAAERAAEAAAADLAHCGFAKAILARIAWDKGDLERAERDLHGATGPLALEVRALLAYARGEYEAGLAVVGRLSREVLDDVALSRLEGTRGMLEHARGQASASLTAFDTAATLASRAGAVVEEATYLTGLAAAAADVGASSRALSASTRAALLWERLGRPTLAARALLGRAAAFALVGARHEADAAAETARALALASGDRRAAAFARWAIVETRPRGDETARAEALAARAELAAASDEDRVRADARVLVWAEGEDVSVDAIDLCVDTLAPAARWEWWGARAAAGPSEARVLSAVVSLLEAPAPLASRGPALFAAARLAAELGDGAAARRIEGALRLSSEALRSGASPEHRAALAEVPWARMSGREAVPGLPAAQVEQLEAIVRALSSRDRLKPLLEQVLDTMVLWTGVERGLLLLRAPDGRLVPRVARNLARRDLRGEQLTLSMSLAGRAMATRETVCATDAFAQVGELHASVHALRLRSVLAVPLVARGSVLGVVYLDDRVRRGAFGPTELAWVRLVASQAALAIADARDQALLRRAVRRAERASERLAGELGAREAELVVMRAELAQGDDTRFRYDEIAGRSAPMREMLRLVDRVTASDVPVLLVGESGTGKELVARAIHKNGPRAKRPFVSENCASVPESLLESTLFGHVRGAFTGAASTRAGLFDVADGGTLFLDEIGEMPLTMQTKLLRVLQNGEVRPVGSERVHRVDVRIVGATHRDLEAMVASGAFREDLYYRLNVVSIRVPPLRERALDIPLLVTHLVERHAAGRRIKVTRAAMDRLCSFPWPGNVRQLENEIRRALVLADERIDVGDLSDEVVRGGPNAARDAGLGLKARIDALEAQLVKDALVQTRGNQTRAAEVLGISRFGLQKMMRRLGIAQDRR